MKLMLLLMLAFVFAAETHAKRVMLPLPPETGLPAAELRHLAKRVGEELRKCPGMKHGAGGKLEVVDLTGKALDMALVKAAIGDELSVAEGASGPIVEIRAELSFREWKSGKYSSTFTLKALVSKAGKRFCEKLHRTVQKRELNKK